MFSHGTFIFFLIRAACINPSLHLVFLFTVDPSTKMNDSKYFYFVSWSLSSSISSWLSINNLFISRKLLGISLLNPKNHPWDDLSSKFGFIPGPGAQNHS